MLSPFTDDSITRLLRAVQRAPSVRESQPWSFRIVAGDRIELRADQARWLKVGDPRARGLTISCGAALFNLRMALRVTGHNVAVWLLPDADRDPSLLASVEIVTQRTIGPSVTHQELYDCIPRCRTNRSPFTGPRVKTNILVTMQMAAAQEEGWLRILNQQQTRQWLRAARDGQRELGTDELYQDELRRLAPDYLMPSGADDPLLSDKFERHPQLLGLSTDEDRPLDWLRAGQALQRALLTGTRFGVVASFLTQPLELRDMPPSTQPAAPRRWPWKWPWDEVPQMVLRVGHVTQERERRLQAPAPERRRHAPWRALADFRSESIGRRTPPRAGRRNQRQVIPRPRTVKRVIDKTRRPGQGSIWAPSRPHHAVLSPQPGMQRGPRMHAHAAERCAHCPSFPSGCQPRIMAFCAAHRGAHAYDSRGWCAAWPGSTLLLE